MEWNEMEWNGMEWNGMEFKSSQKGSRTRFFAVVFSALASSASSLSSSAPRRRWRRRRAVLFVFSSRCRGLLGATARVFSSRRSATPSVGARGRRPVPRRCDRRRDHRTNRCVSCDRTRRGRRRQLLAEGAVQMLKQRGDLDGADPLLAAVGELQFEVGTLSTDSLATTTATAPAARRTAGRRRSSSLKTRRDRSINECATPLPPSNDDLVPHSIARAPHRAHPSN